MNPTASFIFTTLLKIVGTVFLVILPMVSYAVYAERKVSALIQDRLGPNRVGPAGLFQPIAYAMKLFPEEDFTIDHGWMILPFAGNWKNPVGWLLVVPVWISFAVFAIAVFAETNRLPFDLPEAETELVGGYHTEYSSMKFALFFLGEYAAMITGSAIIVTLFLGGWHFPGVPDGSHGWIFGLINIAVFFAKVAALLFIFIWVRFTLPRFRFDQLMRLGWVFFFEIALVNIFLMAGIISLPNA